MRMNETEKRSIKDEVVRSLCDDAEISRVVIFGSFLTADAPNDLDVAVFQTSREAYLPLAIKYRMKLASVARRIPIDVIPVRPNPEKSVFLDEIMAGEVVYER